MLERDIYINPICHYDEFNLGKLIYEKLSTVSDGWIYGGTTLEPDNKVAYQYIIRKSEKNPEIGYGFQIEKIGNTTTDNNPTMAPVICGFRGDQSYTAPRVPTTSLYAWQWPAVYTDNKYIPTDLAFVIGKQKHCYSISVVRHDSGYMLMNAVCGEDTNGDVYALYPGRRPQNDSDMTMQFITFTDNMPDYVSMSMQVNHPADFAKPTDDGMGLMQNNEKLVLSPFVNPITGAICPDLYMPILGPITSRVYEVSIGTRKFVTGSACPPKSSGAITDSDYQSYYKVFVEV